MQIMNIIHEFFAYNAMLLTKDRNLNNGLCIQKSALLDKILVVNRVKVLYNIKVIKNFQSF